MQMTSAVIMAENECGMQKNLNLLNEYCNCNGLRVNIRKKKLWYLQGLRQGFVICQHLNLDLDLVDDYVYLDNLSWVMRFTFYMNVQS